MLQPRTAPATDLEVIWSWDVFLASRLDLKRQLLVGLLLSGFGTGLMLALLVS